MGQAIRVGTEEYSEDEARAVLAGYAFATSSFDKKERSPSYGPVASPGRRPRWGYFAYDCVPPDPSPELSAADFYAAAVLNTEFNVKAATSIRLVAPEVSRELGEIDERQTFWDLRQDEIEPVAIPEEGSPSWHLHRAWYLLMTAPDVGVATAHKLLHHKRPRLVPILDGRTLDWLATGRAWVNIHDDLTSQEETFLALEEWFAELASGRGGRPLSRLRIHDILLWCRATEQDGEARSVGEELLS